MKKKQEQFISHKTYIGLFFTILFFFILLSLEIPYYINGFNISSILVITGTIIYTLGAIISRIPSSKIPIHLQFITNVITFIFIIVAYILAPQLIILEESKDCNLVNKKDNIYYYCLDSIKKAISQKEYKEILDLESFSPTKNNTTLVIEYEDGSKIYQYDSLRILDCSNGDIIYGNRELKYQVNFCNTKDIPNEKKS